jgi:Tfp pilus assembly protein PilF
MSIDPANDLALARLPGLTPRVQRLARAAQQSFAQGDLTEAAALINEALTEAPAHPELLRLCGLSEHFNGRATNAIALFRKAAVAWPQDGLLASNLGAALAQRGDIDAAIAAFRRATALDPMQIDAWFNLGRALELRLDAAGAFAAFGAVLELDPRHQPARILQAEALKTLGHLADAETQLRDVLREDPHSVPAWIALANLKSFRADASDIEQLQRLHRSATLSPAQRIDIGFALGDALEAQRRYAEAFTAFRSAAAAKRATIAWNAPAVSALVDDILAAFPTSPIDAEASDRGSEIVFLVGMPRSGSTLAEQILAAHPHVATGGETGWIAAILQAESNRRVKHFPYWVGDASAADWARLAEEYLSRASLQRGARAVFTDKTLTNWQTLGAIRRMLPGARIVHCERDPLETAWSCFKHNFSADQLYSYDFAELATFFNDATRAMRAWDARMPQRILAHRLETLIAEPESTVRKLLAHCGLAFDAACLRFHENDREVRTASAAQVRQPLRSDTAVAARYGALLDPLRELLARSE